MIRFQPFQSFKTLSLIAIAEGERTVKIAFNL